MKHETYKEWILLSLWGELGEDERGALEAHLANCAGCRAELEEMKATITLFGEAGVTGPSEDMLREVRRDLREAIAGEAGLADRAASPGELPTQDGAWSTPGRSRFPYGVLQGWVGRLSPARVALVGTAAVAIGFLAGYFVFGQKHGIVSPRSTDTARSVDAARSVDGARSVDATQNNRELGTMSYGNVRLAGVDPRSGEVEIEYDMIRPARLKAGIEDARVQNILAQAVVNDDNPGARLQAINTIGAYVGKPHDEQIKRALIQAVKSDPNAGVRKQALYVLYRMTFDNDIKDACLHVLAGDDNEGLRIAAINILAAAMLDGHLKGEDVFDAVGARLQTDENEYIRIQSGAFQQEVNGHVE
jgi:anti-sigma factor RsiW